MDAFRQQGGLPAFSLAEMAHQCNRIILSLPDSKVVTSVLFGEKGLFQSPPFPPYIIDTTTGDPEDARQTALKLADLGASYCDACLIGSSVMIQQGESVLIAGADKSMFSQNNDLFQAITSQIFYMGPPGAGSDTKLVVNLVIGLHRLVLGESLVLAESLGLDLSNILAVLQSGLSYSKVMDTKGEKMIQQDFTPQARLRQHAKDVQLLLTLSQRHHVPLPLTKLHNSILQQGIQMDFGDLDNSAVIEILRSLSSELNEN